MDATTSIANITGIMANERIFTNHTGHGGRSYTNRVKPGVGGILIGVMIVSVIGNAFVLGIIMSKMGGTNRVINCMIISLAAADLAQQVFLNFPIAHVNLVGSWTMGSHFCKIHAWFRSSAIIASVYTLVFIGVER